jgi:transposase
MEACPGAQWLARKLAAMGHTVRIIPAQLVKPFLKSNENDARGAEAIAEAVVRPTTRFVGIKTESQVDLQALHRVRDRIVSNRTQLICQMRAFCLEYGIAMRQGAGVFKIDTMMNALLGPDSPPIGDPDGKKGTGWRSSRKAGEGQTKKVGPTLQDPTG